MDSTEIVETTLGKIRGYKQERITIFKGIPYAAPPIGNLRFRPPFPPHPWSELFNATEFGPDAPQPPNSAEWMFGPFRKQSEADCLTLNIWTPGIDENYRPVLFWIHGGNFMYGNAANEFFDGFPLSSRGDIVVVSIQYRLGPLGYIDLPFVTANLGQLDQIAALKWIQENIGFFGGDSNNITIFGQSAGATAVITLLAMPAAKGLFHRAIAQSPSSYYAAYHRRRSKELLLDLGLNIEDIGALQKIPLEKIREAQDKINVLRIESKESSPFSPTVDGNTLPDIPLKKIKEGFSSEIPLLIGTTLDEWKFLRPFIPNFAEVDNSELKENVIKVLSRFKKDEKVAEQIIRTYQIAKEGKLSTKPQDILDAIETDVNFRLHAIYLAEAQCVHQPKIYMYLFTMKSPMLEGRLGASHAMDIPFVFGTLDKPNAALYSGEGDAVKSLSLKMMDSWISFIRTGDPNHNDIPKWPMYNINNRSTMIFGKEVKVEERPFDKERAAWDGIFNY